MKLKKLSQLIIAPWKYLYMMNKDCSNYNSVQARRKSRTKEKMKVLFLKHNIPTANSMTFFNSKKALNFVKEHGYPVVIKPNFGGYSRGSFFPIKNKEELLKASFLVKFFWPKAIVETYLQGKNYRVVVAYNKIIALTQRFSPYVIGDGKSTISTLISIENKLRIKKKLLPTIHLIEENNEIKSFLKKQDLTLASIPKKNEVITLHNKIALNPGGSIHNENISTISKKNKELFLKINKIFGADVFGIDIIFEKSVSIDYDKQKTIVLEVNSRPFLDMHSFPSKGKSINVNVEIEKLRDEL